MDLVTTLTVGAYVYTTGAIVWLNRRFESAIEKITVNHIKHLEERIKTLERKG